MANEHQAIVSSRRRLPTVWIIPLVALVVGVGMVINHYRTQGPEITITFTTAEGIEAGKTKIKALSVDIGIIETVTLNPDLKGVTLMARLDQKAAHLLHDDSEFWVVRPRIGAAGITGFGTLLSGAYIELSPGTGKIGKRNFQGLDNVPVTHTDESGLYITLLSDEAISVSAGDPVLYHGYDVGSIDSTKLDAETQKLEVNLFIKSPYDRLVTSTSRFWNDSGISFQASAQGVSLRTGSLATLIRGGVTFDLPEGAKPGSAVENHTKFKLYPDASSINVYPYKYYEEYLLLFDTSVGGLEKDAPVLYRGVRIGTVTDVGFSIIDVDLLRTKGRAVSVPVLIRIEPGRWLGKDTEEAKTKAMAHIEKQINSGIRATIKMGNLLTGARLIAFDIYKDVEPATIGKVGEFNTFPTISTGLEEIQVKVADLLDKLNELPLKTVLNDVGVTLKQVTHTLDTANQTVNDLNTILEKRATQHMPESINKTLDDLRIALKSFSPDSAIYQNLSESIEQLNATMRSIESLTYTIDTKPNSLIFSKPKDQDTQPEAAIK